ncbi:hypothetical protein P9857_01640 [Anoxybacillus geothermalis]|uniref:hypothetical protein n=1 Tax=Geobacillus TaxID=129337 RepID=UPI0013E96841|nr:hypothetical protein [Geobacillus sp. PK12]MED5072778.1 hypothetical protein [Anoxybacillus geothermalis]WJQ09546.1 hypothetical protein QT237_12465 [Geobacillus stearothermophilus]
MGAAWPFAAAGADESSLVERRSGSPYRYISSAFLYVCSVLIVPASGLALGGTFRYT